MQAEAAGGLQPGLELCLCGAQLQIASQAGVLLSCPGLNPKICCGRLCSAPGARGRGEGTASIGERSVQA